MCLLKNVIQNQNINLKCKAATYYSQLLTGQDWISQLCLNKDNIAVGLKRAAERHLKTSYKKIMYKEKQNVIIEVLNVDRITLDSKAVGSILYRENIV